MIYSYIGWDSTGGLAWRLFDFRISQADHGRCANEDWLKITGQQLYRVITPSCSNLFRPIALPILLKGFLVQLDINALKNDYAKISKLSDWTIGSSILPQWYDIYRRVAVRTSRYMYYVRVCVLENCHEFYQFYPLDRTK